MSGQKYDVLTLPIPLRLSIEERTKLHLLNKSLDVSEYTDTVEVPARGYGGAAVRQERIEQALEEFYDIIIGLQRAASPPTALKKKLEGAERFADLKDYFSDLFEIGRRYKMMNPDRMRNEYGKLLYLMQDACNPDSAEKYGFVPMKAVQTVQTSLVSLGLMEKIKEDPRLIHATSALRPSALNPEELECAKARKEKYLSEIVEEYAPLLEEKKGGKELLERCLRSIDDANCYVRDNVETLDRMISLLEQNFTEPAEGMSLDLGWRVGGARLSHDHGEQFYYVLQTLHLWRLVALHMFNLWDCVEADMINDKGYGFRNTGQGYNRVQSAPRTCRAMNDLVGRAMRATKMSWVGLSVVHMGDDQVPNALSFIEKYTSVSRIVNPILSCVSSLERICQWPGITEYVGGNWGSKERLGAVILRDYFKHGFDGSGGDNPADAGSCIDGRLTSSWNWCHKIADKSYYPAFLLAGFTSFDAF